MQMENVIVVYHVSKVPQPGVKKKKENKLCAGINDSGHLCPKKWNKLFRSVFKNISMLQIGNGNMKVFKVMKNDMVVTKKT